MATNFKGGLDVPKGKLCIDKKPITLSAEEINSLPQQLRDQVLTLPDGSTITAEMITETDDKQFISAAEKASIQDKANASDVYTKTQTDERIQAVIGAAPSALDTLNEIAEALGDDEDFAASVVTTLAGKVDAEEGKRLSANDFTDEEKQKLASISGTGGGSSVTTSTINGNIVVDGVEKQVYRHPNDTNTRHLTDAKIAQYDGYAAQFTNLQAGADPYNALGYAGIVANDSTDCTAGFNNAINTLNANGKRKLYIPAGNYRINGTIVVPAYFTLEMDRSTYIKQNSTTAYAIQMKDQSVLKGGFIYILSENSTGGGILLNGDDKVTDCRIQNVTIFQAGWLSTGIYFNSSNPAGRITTCYTMFNMISNCIIRNGLYGIRLKTNDAGSWNTATLVQNCQIWKPVHPIWIDYCCGGNLFENVGIQGGDHVEEYVFCDGDLNQFKNVIYYDNYYTDLYAYHFGSRSTYCKADLWMPSNLQGGKCLDQGTENKLVW